jgi:hypothetical protein
MDWYRENYPEIIEDKRIVPIPYLEQITGGPGATVTLFGEDFDTAFVDSTLPADRIAGVIRHETLHLEQTPEERRRMQEQDRRAMERHRRDPANLPYGPIHERIYLEGDRFRQLYRGSVR